MKLCLKFLAKIFSESFSAEIEIHKIDPRSACYIGIYGSESVKGSTTVDNYSVFVRNEVLQLGKHVQGLYVTILLIFRQTFRNFDTTPFF
jgi:hypothetical protein